MSAGASPSAAPARSAARTRASSSSIAERLGDVVVGADVERLDLVVGLLARRQHDDRDAARGPQPREHLDAVEVGQPEVEQHHVRRRSCDDVPAPTPVAGELSTS